MFLFILKNLPRNVSGDYRIMINIEDDEVTCNSYVVFSQVKKDVHNFIYVDRHGNWVVGKSSTNIYLGNPLYLSRF